jgi:hypothetical protein
VHILVEHQTVVYNICEENVLLYAHTYIGYIHTYIHTYVCIYTCTYICDYFSVDEFECLLLLGDEGCCPSRNRTVGSCLLLISTIFSSAGNWSLWPPTEWTFWEAFRNLVTCKEIFCFIICREGSDTDEFKLLFHCLLYKIAVSSRLPCNQGQETRMIFTDGIIVSHFLNLAVSLVSDFPYSPFDRFSTRIFMKTLRVKSQLMLPSVICYPEYFILKRVLAA